MMRNNCGRLRLILYKRAGRRPTTPMGLRQLFGLLAAISVPIAFLPLAHRVEAQVCTADEQCRTEQGPAAECVGDILVFKRRVCLGGACREIEERRETCGAAEVSRCRGDAFEQTARRCDAVLGRCEQRIERELCLKSCDCRDNTVYMSTGQCSPTLGCTRVTMKCEHGCTCSPEPKCLEAPGKQ
jgi:hypothetical protein